MGLLHDVTQALWERELTGASGASLCSPRPLTPRSVHRAHVSTSPSNQAVDLFYVTGVILPAARAHICADTSRSPDLHGELPSTERFADVQRCAPGQRDAHVTSLTVLRQLRALTAGRRPRQVLALPRPAQPRLLLRLDYSL